MNKSSISLLKPFIGMITLLILSGNVVAQLTVVQGSAMGLTPEQLVQNHLVGAGITVSNVTYNGSSASITSNQIGTFQTAGMATGQLGLSAGILMTSGKASIAIGPNNAAGAGSNTGGPGDPDLNAISGTTTFDKAVLEFDFIPQSDTVRFRYVFGSDEFMEFCNQINDAFGFFLSGPGINGTFSNNSVNIARMPGSFADYVTINNICADPTSRWSNPTGGQWFQYDALTNVFTASYTVTPCSTYHIKLAIGDAVDHIYDSGVFLEENSFSSPAVEMINNSTIPALGNRAVETCNDVAVNFRLGTLLDYPFTIHYTIGGSAINGTDYTLINNQVTFPPGVDSIDVIIHPIADNVPEGRESIILTLNQISCDGIIKRDTIYIEDYDPFVIIPNNDTVLCHGGSITLKATTSGGITPFTYSWNIPGNDSIVTLIPPVGQNNYTVKVSDVCSHSVFDTALVTVHPVPVANAGPDVSIANGTSTTLNGSASGGYGNYSYSWTSNPPGFTSGLPNPSTGNMSHTLIFILKVTDIASGCQSEPDQVIVAVEGGPLTVNPVAQPDAVCLGDTVQLFALSGGGSGLYTFTWSSQPAGFSSQEENPLIIPDITRRYTVIVNDGFNQITGFADVTVYPLPVIYLGPSDSTVCIYDTVILDAGNPGSLYQWSNGSVNRTVTLATTGIGYDVQTLSVVVTNQDGCKSKATINVIFTYDDCLGLDELTEKPVFRIFPNPADGFFTVEMLDGSHYAGISLFNVLGSEILSAVIDRSVVPEMRIDYSIHELPKGIYFIKVKSDRSAGAAKLIVR